MMAPAAGEAPAVDGHRLIDESLFVTVADGGAPVRLAGSRCRACGAVAFPAQSSCARCTGEDVVPEALSATGTVWAATVQRFTPKPPYLGAAGSPPYAVGYVDLGDVLVESRLVGDPESFAIGTPVHLVLEQVPGTDDDPAWTFAFAADTGGSR